MKQIYRECLTRSNHYVEIATKSTDDYFFGYIYIGGQKVLSRWDLQLMHENPNLHIVLFRRSEEDKHFQELKEEALKKSRDEKPKTKI